MRGLWAAGGVVCSSGCQDDHLSTRPITAASRGAEVAS